MQVEETESKKGETKAVEIHLFLIKSNFTAFLILLMFFLMWWY